MRAFILGLALVLIWITNVSAAFAGGYPKRLLIGPTVFFLLPAIWILRRRVSMVSLLESTRNHVIPGALVIGTLAGSAVAAGFVRGATTYAVLMPLLLLILSGAGAAMTMQVQSAAGVRRGGFRSGIRTAIPGIVIAVAIAAPVATLLAAVSEGAFRKAVAGMTASSSRFPSEARDAFRQAARSDNSVSAVPARAAVATVFLFGPVVLIVSGTAGALAAQTRRK